MKEKVAIIGTGVAGLGCAWHLKDSAQLTLIEQNAKPGGHTNTVDVQENSRTVPIDTGFIVFNKVTYPNLCQLFEELKVPIKPSEMSFSVQHLPTGLEYNGMGVNKVFAQRRNLFSLRFHVFLQKITKFFRVANELLESPEVSSLTMREFALKHGLGQDFLDLYLVPMSSAVWSTEAADVLDFPAATLIRFFHNHGFLGVDTHHPWFTVDGGARTYVERIISAVGAPRLNARVLGVKETSHSAVVTTHTGEEWHFDRVILASHADQSLRMLEEPDANQQRILEPFRYQKNHATLHTDDSVMPRRRRAWASWNYQVRTKGEATTHYWMNALQGVSDKQNYFLSLNSQGRIPRDKVLYETEYEHPVYTLDAIRAQNELHSLNTRDRNQRIFFCGSYFKYGFHEDAYSSGLYLATLLRDRLNAAS